MSDPLPPAFVHDTAVVEDGAVIGAGSRVWHHAHLRAGARIGEECVVGKGVFVDVHVRLGDRVHVQNNACLYAGVVIEDDVFVGPGAVLTNDRLPRAASPGWRPIATLVRRGASIGANATVICGVELGPWSMVGAGSVVTRTVDDHELVVGNPARRRGWVCACGHVLATGTGDMPAVSCPRCGGLNG